MDKKLLASIIATVLIVAGSLTASALILQSKKAAQVAKTNDSEIKLSADGTRDYGACTFVDKAFVQSTIGSAASNLQGPDTVGLALLGTGDQVQVCAYSFVTGGTAANQFNVNDGFSIEVFIHKDQASRTAYSTLHDPGTDSVSGIGEKATYLGQAFSDGHQNYTLTVYTGLKHYNFVINQPSGSKNFTTDSAKQILTVIAKSASY